MSTTQSQRLVLHAPDSAVFLVSIFLIEIATIYMEQTWFRTTMLSRVNLYLSIRQLP